MRKNTFNKHQFEIGIIILSLFFIFGLIINKYRQIDINDKDLIKIKGTVSNKLEIERHKSSRGIPISLREYPKLTFNIGDYAFEASYYIDIINNLKIGDTIIIGIDKLRYEKEIALIKPKSITDKFLGIYIDIYSLADIKQKYLTIDMYNQYRNDDNQSIGFWCFLLISVYGLFYGIKEILINASS